MDKDQALQIVASACAGIQGTLKDHQVIQEALKVIQNALNPKPVETEIKEE